MQTTTRVAGDVQILALSGRFDTHEAPLVAGWLARALDTGSPHIVVNLGGVSFIDSAGLAALVNGMKRCRSQGGDLHLCNFQQPVRIIFELTRMDRAFMLFDSEDEALREWA